MIIRKCDRCKKEITEDAYKHNPFEALGAKLREAYGIKSNSDYIFKVIRCLQYSSDSFTPDGVLDLCPACSKSLFKWFYDTEEAKQDE